ncbi:MAG: GMC oxidoreductase [Acidimicrobiales bacterium]|jgi:choline dehydrogenase-like flavoprotein
MPTALIIGSGPGAAGTALALTADPAHEVTVIDLGGTLEADLSLARSKIASIEEASWSPSDVGRINQQPSPVEIGAIPQKQAFGSDFPFRDVGQLDGIEAVGPTNPSVVSGAYGGFSNVWGAQIMPFSRATFDRWPLTLEDMESHYRSALSEMTLAGAEDDLSEVFPLMVEAGQLPPLADRSERVLDRYQARRAFVRSHAITVGRARLAFRSGDCTCCGLCMTGCPYQLIYSSSHTFDRLRSEGRIAYRPNLLATRLEERDGSPSVRVQDTNTGARQRFSADRIFVACGGIGTARLVLGSLGKFDRTTRVQESVQFVMPTISLRPVPDPRQERNFTLNQFNLLYDHTGEAVDLCQIHFYDYNPAFLSSLPSFLSGRRAEPVLAGLLRRISVGLGYIPSWGSPEVRLTTRRPRDDEQLPTLEIDREQIEGWPPMLRGLVRSMSKVAPALDLWPVVPMISVSAAAKSYHFGGTFPHGRVRSEQTTDVLGRLAAWDNIHLVDGSVFPTVPATTFTLTVMANAHRIASGVLEMPR